jgi:hypothetical protein
MTLTTCARCGTPIRGEYISPGVIVVGFTFDPPAYCHNCGGAFPWTERKRQAAIDLFVDEIQEEAARREFEESVNQVTHDTPQAPVAAGRLRRLFGKLKSGTAEVVRKLVVDIAAEAVKGSL